MTLLQRYQEYCKCIETTPLYVEFSFYSLIASCLQRRVWCGVTEEFDVYPNLYMVFVGAPGSGKTNAAVVNKRILSRIYIWDGRINDHVNPIYVAPDTTTLESLIDKMAKNTQQFQYPDQYHFKAHSSITFISEELSVLFKQEDGVELVRFLIQGYDGKDFKKETKYCGDNKIVNMCINFLAATTPEWMAKATSFSSVLSEGFLSRTLFIAGGAKKKVTFFEPNAEQKEHLEYIRKTCVTLSQICGPCLFTPAARDYFDDWYHNRNRYLNPDKKLIHYYERKKITAIKLAIIMSIIEDPRKMAIEIRHVDQALEALARIEVNMHEALASVAKNPVHSIAASIHKFLLTRKTLNFAQKEEVAYTPTELWLKFHDEAELKMIEDALQYLMMAGKVVLKGSKLKGGITQPLFEAKLEPEEKAGNDEDQ